MVPPYLCPKVWVVTAGWVENVPGKVKKIAQTQTANTAFVARLVGGSSSRQSF